MNITLRELTHTEVIGVNRSVILDAHRKDPASQQKHILVRPLDLQSCLAGIFFQSAQGYMHYPLEKIAGLLLYRIAQGQFFIDGNKRTAISSCYFFLLNNGHSLRTDRKTVSELLWGFSPPEDDPSAAPRYTDSDAIQFVFDNIAPRV